MDSTTPDVKQSAPAPARPSGSRRPPEHLRWPPPGLDRIQGDLARILGELLIGGALLVLPLLWILRQGEGRVWPGWPEQGYWIVLAVSAIGLLLFIVASVRVFRLLRRAAQGTDLGYDWRTMALVASDSRRDTGLLLQGGQTFSVLEDDLRRTVADTRIRTAGLWLLGSLWLPVGFALGVLFAGRGLLSLNGLIGLAVAPTAALLFAGYILRAWENGVLKKARREWHRGPWAKDFELGEIQLWRQRFAAARGELSSDREGGPTMVSRRLRIAMWAGVPALLFIGIPAITIGVSAGVGPLVAQISIPTYVESARRLAQLEPLWRHRAQVDSTVSPQAAGESLRALEQVGGEGPRTFGPAPVRTYEAPFNPLSADWRSMSEFISSHGGDEVWVDFLFSSMDRLAEDDLAVLRAAAQHPALDEFAILGGASELDFVHAFWPSPYPENLSAIDLPIPRFGTIREAGYVAIVRAAVARREGRNEEAEQILREVITAGLLLGRDSPTLIGSLVGSVVAGNGGKALVAFYRSVGRTVEAEELAASLELAKRLSESGGLDRGTSQQPSLEAIAEVVTDSSLPRGLRWEHFAVVSMIAPCASGGRILFEEGEAFTQWRDEARQDLVHFPSEEALFDLTSKGLKGYSPESLGIPRGMTMRLITGVMGGVGAGRCALAFEAMASGGIN